MSEQDNIEALLAAVEKLGDYKFEDRAQRRKSMLAVRKVTSKLEEPYDKILDMWGSLARDAAMKVCIDVDLFTRWHAISKVQTARQLAEATGVEVDLMATLLKHLASWHIVEEEGADTYAQTSYSLEYLKPEIAACVNLHFGAFVDTFPKLPAYLQSTSYRRPTNASFSPLSYSVNFPGTAFEYIAQRNQQLGKALDLTMKGYSEYRGNWVDVYPVDGLLQTAAENQVIIVDVGGGLGHDLIKFRTKFPDVPGDRLILQDLPHVIDGIGGLDGIQLISHDFLTKQTVQGARAYFLHQILHDWPDADCLRILDCLRPALEKESRILINEMVVPATNASMNATTYDLIMMAMFSARERTEMAWRELITKAGLKIVKIWSSPLAVESVIEVALP